MKKLCLLSTVALLASGCSTLNESLQLGSVMGTIGGAGATFAGYSGGGKSPSVGTIGIGAGVGAAVGLLTSYFIHKKVEEDRAECGADQVEMNFGDLPPNPFDVPKMIKKGGKR